MRVLKRWIRSAITRAAQPDPQSIIGNRFVAGKLFPADPVGPYHLVPKPSNNSPRGVAELPVPPPHMWEGYGRDAQEYLGSGQRHLSAMVDILANAGARAEELERVLDLGCGAGRLLRFFPRNRDGQERWGVDISAEYITWCQAHLSPPFLFATTTTLPHLPFEDNSFDLVYCGSVFTHITDLADAWFLELRRVLRAGGHAYITIQDKASMQAMLSRYHANPPDPGSIRSFVKVNGDPGTSPMGLHAVHQADKATGAGSKDFASFSYSTDPFSNIFYDTEFLAQKWGRLAQIVSITPGAYGSQTALLWRKR